MPREKLGEEVFVYPVRLTRDLEARMQAAMEPAEPQAKFVREAIEALIRKREKEKPKG